MRAISSKSVIRSWVIPAVFFLCINSCNRIENRNELEAKEEHNFTVVPVAINFSSISNKNEDQDSTKDTDFSNTQVIVRGVNADSLNVSTQPKVLALGENNSIIAYVYLKYEAYKVDKVKELQKGDKFRVIAYKKSDGTYHSHKDYTVGNLYENLQLNSGVEYEIVSYAFGGEVLPDISDLEKTNINAVGEHFDKEKNSLIAYRKQYFTPSSKDSGKNIIHINLFDQSSSIGIVFRSLGSGIPIDNASFIMRTKTSFCSEKIDLDTGKSGCNKEDKMVVNVGGGLSTSYDHQFFVLSDRKRISLDAKVKISGSDEYLNDIYFHAIQGRKTTVYIDFRICGAYTGAGKTNFRRFMCNDLGGDVINPNQNIVRNEQHGDFYIWGMKAPILSRQFFQEHPQDRSKWKFDWSEDSKNRMKIVGSFIGACPKGWHIPDSYEWDSVANNNSLENVHEGKSSFSLGIRVGENMLLPLSGFIGSNGATDLPSTDSSAYRWASDRVNSSSVKANGNMVRFNKRGESGVYYGLSIFRGHPLRCMKYQK